MLAESLIAILGIMSAQAATLPAAPMTWHALPTARYASPSVIAPQKKNAEEVGVLTTGRAAVLLDVKSGTVLYERNADAVHPIASLTKLMTAMVILDEHLPMDEMITIAPEDEAKEGKAVFGSGERFTRGELLHALLIGSVNTAGYALARTSQGGTEGTIIAMNKKAQELGLDTATFLDPTGLDRGNRASAQEVATMLRAALFYSDIRSITKQTSIELKGRATGKPYLIKSTNLLLDSFLNKAPYSIIAAKTGSLPEAGFCLAQATQDKAGNKVIAVTLGSDNHFSRYQDVKAMTAWGFQAYQWPTTVSGQ